MQYFPPEYLSLMSHFNHDKYIVSNSLLSGPSEQRKNGSHASSRSHLLTQKSPWPSPHHPTYSHGWCTHRSGHSDVWWCHDGKDSLLRVFKASFFLTCKLLQDWTCPSTIRHASTNCEKWIFLLLSQFAGWYSDVFFCEPLMDMEWLILGVFPNPRWSAVWGPRTLKSLHKPTATFDNLVVERCLWYVYYCFIIR